MSFNPNSIELVSPDVPRGAREINRREDGTNKIGWFLLAKNGPHFVHVYTLEENWMPFGLKIPEDIAQDVYYHPFAAAAQAGAGRISVLASNEAPARKPEPIWT